MNTLSADLSAETLHARRGWRNIFKVLKEKVLIKNTVFSKVVQNWEIKCFPDWQKLKISITTGLALQEMLKGLVEAESKET